MAKLKIEIEVAKVGETYVSSITDDIGSNGDIIAVEDKDEFVNTLLNRVTEYIGILD